ncbi:MULTISPECIES: hypothetical protein [unclassified Acetobacterium]|jgi:hypothetical protein|uniref:hypothetical protein n=1 Tax=unclassified Acetobacterium TaxID=2638182 RepID=UPI000DBEC462|nr:MULTISPECIES: hypothetical protein [unclassified Acetobacterium]AWW27728.1 hypothetical protein DOZ58_14420 [Acetobacterium sp. KB-1]MDZ5725936.1 hypothetical protein [Acetobacterium sp. K1/6]
MNNFEVNEYLREHLEKKEVKKVASDLSVMVYTDRTLSDGRLMEMLKYIKTSYSDVYEQLIEKCDESQYKRLSQNGQLICKEINEDTFADAVFALENNFCSERIEDIRVLGKHLYSQNESAENKKEVTVPVAKSSERKAVVQQKGTIPVGEQRRSPKKKKISGGLVLILAGLALLAVVAIVLTIK